MYWSRLNQVVSAFCLENALDSCNDDKMICSLVGEELEWCGSHSYLFMASRYMQATSRIAELERRRQLAELSLNKEAANSAGLRKALKQLQVSSEDTEWQLQEQLAAAKHQTELERGNSTELQEQLLAMQRRLSQLEAPGTSASVSASAAAGEEGDGFGFGRMARAAAADRGRGIEIEELDAEADSWGGPAARSQPPPRSSAGKMLFAVSVAAAPPPPSLNKENTNTGNVNVNVPPAALQYKAFYGDGGGF